VFVAVLHQARVGIQGDGTISVRLDTLADERSRRDQQCEQSGDGVHRWLLRRPEFPSSDIVPDAASPLLYGWQKRSTSDPTRKAQNAGISTQDALYANKWGKARDAMGLTSVRVSHLTESWDNLKAALETYGPMWCAGDFLQGSPHVVVISGYDSDGKLRINDPL
jgi:hypothetical protein